MAEPEKTFLAHLHQHFLSLQDKDAFRTFRDKSWQRLSALGLPTRSHEAFRYVSLRELYQSSFNNCSTEPIDKFSFAEAILPECKHSHLIFINGRFSPASSDISALPPQTVLLGLDEASRTHASFLQSHLSQFLKEENDPIALANLSLCDQGAFFYFPPKLKAKAPIQTLFVFSDLESIISSPRLYIAVGAHSQLEWIVTSHLFKTDVSHFFLPSTHISLEEGSSLHLVNAVDCPENSWRMESLRAGLKKNARLHSLNVTFGAKTDRQSYRIHLKGENSEADLNGLWLLNKNHTAHTHAIIEHEAPHTRSMQLFKGVLSGSSQSSFEGKILVRPEAQKTEAYQLNKNLILNHGAIANSKPNLEIFADDVKASHGATVSQLDQEQLFYLKTRGIDLDQAKRLLIGGFCRELIGKMNNDSLQKKILCQLFRTQESFEN